MAPLESTALERYGRVLRAVDAESRRVGADEYLELLGPGEVDELLLARDEISKLPLDASQRAEVEALDELLVKHCPLIAEWMPPRRGEPRSHWWWYLDEGPQVRKEARARRRRAG